MIGSKKRTQLQADHPHREYECTDASRRYPDDEQEYGVDLVVHNTVPRAASIALRRRKEDLIHPGRVVLSGGSCGHCIGHH
jgi:hypothetical protein